MCRKFVLVIIFALVLPFPAFADGWCYSNNGLSWMLVHNSTDCVNGEIWFSNTPTQVQLESDFPNYTAARTAQLAQLAYANAIAAGLNITSTSTPTLDGDYALDSSQQGVITEVSLYIAINNKFPDSLTSVQLRLVNGATVSIGTPAEFQVIGTAVANYISQLDHQLLLAQGGTPPVWPANSVTVQ